MNNYLHKNPKAHWEKLIRSEETWVPKITLRVRVGSKKPSKISLKIKHQEIMRKVKHFRNLNFV